MPAQPPLVTLIVVAFNSRAHFGRLRVALEAQREPRFRLIVVDNASRPDQRPTETDFPGAHILQLDANLGFAGANNLAAKDAATPFVALLNPDAFPEPDWLHELLAAAQRWPIAAAFGSTQWRDGEAGVLDGTGDEMFVLGLPYRSSYGKHWSAGVSPVPDETPAIQPFAERETFSACAAAALYRTTVFRELGGFDETFFCFGEDVDLGYRMRLAGHAVIQVGNAVVHHVGGASTGRRSPFADFHAARNRVWTFVKNTPPPYFLALLPVHLAVTFGMALANSAGGRGWAGLQGWLAALKGFADVIAQRRIVQHARRASPGSLMAAMIWNPLDAMRRAPRR